MEDIKNYIVQILKDKQEPLKAREILYILMRKYKMTKINKKLVNQVLFRELKAFVSYDQETYKYFLIENGKANNTDNSNQSETKSIDISVIEKIITEEKHRIGKSDATLLAENILLRITKLNATNKSN